MSKTTLVAIVGSRKFSDIKLVRSYIEDLYARNLSTGMYKIVSGGANGVDSIAEEEAKKWNMFDQCFEAEWSKYGKKAGYLRNKKMIEYANEVVAFWDGTSKGTKHSIDLALEMKKPLTIFVRY